MEKKEKYLREEFAKPICFLAGIIFIAPHIPIIPAIVVGIIFLFIAFFLDIAERIYDL